MKNTPKNKKPPPKMKIHFGFLEGEPAAGGNFWGFGYLKCQISFTKIHFSTLNPKKNPPAAGSRLHWMIILLSDNRGCLQGNAFPKSSKNLARRIASWTQVTPIQCHTHVSVHRSTWHCRNYHYNMMKSQLRSQDAHGSLNIVPHNKYPAF